MTYLKNEIYYFNTNKTQYFNILFNWDCQTFGWRIVVVDLQQVARMADDGTHVALVVLDIVVPVAVRPVAVVIVDSLERVVTVNLAAAVVTHHQGGLGRDIDDGVMPS